VVGTSDDQTPDEFLAALRVGDLCSGTVTAVSRSHGLAVTLDGFPARPLGTVGPGELSWRRFPAAPVEVGSRITAEVTAVDLDECRARLSTAATENPELWAFLNQLQPGEILSGTVAAIERFGVFVALDDGPRHPVFPGVGFITIPELSWHRFEAATDVVQVGQRVSCEFIQFDTWNGEARLSLRAMQADPFHAFAEGIAVGDALRGRVTKLVPFGLFVEVADGVEGFIHRREVSGTPLEDPDGVAQVGDEITVLVTEIDRVRRKLALSRR
jgi:small subunit ribosomal protein S1